MSLKIIKAGILDTVQDLGRFGHQHNGINPGGAMDRYHGQLANALLGKDVTAPVLELHFPAACFLFEQQAVVCITGAGFSPLINEIPIPVNQPIVVNSNTVLEFRKWKAGARCYLSFLPELRVQKWLNSFSTNLKAATGGWQGRCLQKDDQLVFKHLYDLSGILKDKVCQTLPWQVQSEINLKQPAVQFIIGHEWNKLTEASKQEFQKGVFYITTKADRMGYRLKGKELALKEPLQLVSSGVKFGTVQLLPNGQLLVLMADHQTTGGYPRIAHVIAADLPVLAQVPIQGAIHFQLTDLYTAEQKGIQQQKKLEQIQIASKFNMEKWFSDGFRS